MFCCERKANIAQRVQFLQKLPSYSIIVALAQIKRSFVDGSGTVVIAKTFKKVP